MRGRSGFQYKPISHIYNSGVRESNYRSGALHWGMLQSMQPVFAARPNYFSSRMKVACTQLSPHNPVWIRCSACLSSTVFSWLQVFPVQLLLLPGRGIYISLLLFPFRVYLGRIFRLLIARPSFLRRVGRCVLWIRSFQLYYFNQPGWLPCIADNLLPQVQVVRTWTISSRRWTTMHTPWKCRSRYFPSSNVSR